jgi:hypothetical protein
MNCVTFLFTGMLNVIVVFFKCYVVNVKFESNVSKKAITTSLDVVPKNE